MDRHKLAKLCEMLRSDNPHERSLAAARATELITRAGRTWTDLILSETNTPAQYPASTPGNRSPKATRASAVRYTEMDGIEAESIVTRLQAIRHKLTAWESDFVNCLRLQGPSKGLTRQQWAVVKTLARTQRIWPTRSRTSARTNKT